MSIVPGVRKKLSPIVVPESAGTVRARFSNVNMLKSGVHVITGGASTPPPGALWKATLLSWKPSPQKGAAYHQVRAQGVHPRGTSVRPKDEPSAPNLPLIGPPPPA